MHSFQIGHHRTHHTSGKSAFQEQRRHMLVGRVHKITQKIVNELLCHGTGFHVGFHINLRYLKSRVFQHSLHTQQVSVSRTPWQRFHAHVNIIATSLANFENACHIETGPGMAMILNGDFGMRSLDIGYYFTQRNGTADACHILDTNFIGSQFD